MMIRDLLSQPQRQQFVTVLQLAVWVGKDADGTPLLRIVQKLCPDAPGIWIMEAMQHMAARRWLLARRTLEEADRTLAPYAKIKAMLATVLFRIGDPMWESSADEARRLDPSAEVLAILEPIEGALRRRAGEAAADDPAPSRDAPASAPCYPVFGFPC